MSRALVVVAHPCADSFCHAAAAAAERGLVARGIEVDTLDLYAIGFRGAMSPDERRAYESDDPISDPMVAEHVELLRKEPTIYGDTESGCCGGPDERTLTIHP